MIIPPCFSEWDGLCSIFLSHVWFIARSAARQPLPTATMDPAYSQSPRQLLSAQLVEQVRLWIADGLQVFGVQESGGFGFTLHCELVAAGARKTDKLDVRAFGLRLARWLDGHRDELPPHPHSDCRPLPIGWGEGRERGQRNFPGERTRGAI